MTHICHNCIREPVLSAELRTQGDQANCDWCRRDARGFDAERLATRVATAYETAIGPAEEGFVSRDGRLDWGPKGRAPADLMTELIQADDDALGLELVRILAGRNHWQVHEGGYDYYDETSENTDFIAARTSPLHQAWTDFCNRLRHDSRFFGSHEALDAIFKPVLSGRFAKKAIRQIKPGGPLSVLYRGRRANDEAAQKKIFEHPLRQLASPPRGIADAGRMNSAGISVFYGAFDMDTCLAELRVPVGGAAVIGRFEVIRPLRLLDLSKLEKLQERQSYFDADYIDRIDYHQFIRSFHAEIKRAVIPGRESLDYLPTQAVAEYLWTQSEAQIDGVIFGSAQISGTHKNVVLFPHACTVDGAEAEPKRKVHWLTDEGPDEDDQDREFSLRVYLEPPLEKAKGDARVLPRDEDWFSDLVDAATAPAQPALRLSPNGLEVVTVEAIRLKSAARPVRMEDWPNYPDL